MGGYVGLKKDVFLIRNDAVVGTESERFVTEDICKTHTFTPWDINGTAPSAPVASSGKDGRSKR